ncbi:MAG: CoA-binding protein, partial [bacterium]
MDINSIFNPKSIAVIGASTKVGSVGNDIIKNLATQGYGGKLYPVNPKADELYGLKCYANICEIANEIELAIVIVPAVAVPEVMKEAAKKGVKGAIVISAGFKEIGNTELENEVKQICIENGIALVGPNCLGVLNPKIKMNASFAIMPPKKGHVAFISQSGALVTAILDYAKNLGIGFSKFISVGNKAMLDENILLNYLAQDKDTKVIAMYAEDLCKAQEIINVAKKITRAKNPKPIIILKSGKTSAGASASAS